MVVQAMPLVLARQAHRQPALACLPAAEGARLEAVGLDRPVPRHRHFLGQQAQLPAVAVGHPEGRMRRLGVALPAQPLLVPQAVVGVAACLDEFEELAVADQVAGGLESRNVARVFAVFVVPAVNRVVEATTESHAAGRNVDQRILRRRSRLVARCPGRMRLRVLQRMLAHQHRRGLEVNALVLDAHQHRPERALPANRQGERGVADDAVDQRPHPPPVVGDLGHRRPVVAGVVEVVPAHFVDANGEHRLEARVEALVDQAGEDELVDEEGRGVAEIKNQRVAQADRLLVVGLVAGQHFEQRLVAVTGAVKIVQDFSTLGFDIGAVKQRRAGKKLAHRQVNWLQ